jgi:hypothetical protein
MRFRTAPHPIARLFIGDVAFRRHLCSIFIIDELHLLDNHSVMVLLPFDQDVVRLDICHRPGATPTEEGKFTDVHNVLIMQRRKSAQRVFEDSLRERDRASPFGPY